MSRRIAIVFAAPHRLAFLAGSINLALLAAWWMMQLAVMHAGLPALPQGNLPPALLHGPAMLFLIFPPFVFGFLLTVFPRWMGYADLGPGSFGPVATGLALGSLAVHAGLWSGVDQLVLAGFLLIVLGWGLGLAVLTRVVLGNLRDRKPACWHAISVLAALGLGLIALLLSAIFVADADAASWRLGNQIGIFGFLLPVFLTVSHRMVPFFAGNVIQDYARWRPDWLLAVLWIFLLARLGGDIAALMPLSVAGSLGLAVTTGVMAWKWWPRAASPGLLKVLIWGFAWAPAGFMLSIADQAGLPLGLAPVHAILIGFCGSMLIAMVTRVTQGHSGGALEMTGVAWLAFVAVQLAVGARIGAAMASENGALLVIAAGVFLLGLLPWTVRNAMIYLRARVDGRAG